MKYIRLFENYNNQQAINHFFEIRETNKHNVDNSITFEKIYNEYLEKRDSVVVDDECETGLDVYDKILNLLEKNKNSQSIKLCRAMFISNNINDINKVYNISRTYQGVGEYWSFGETSFPMDSSELDQLDIDNSLEILIYADVTPDVIDWENTFKHSVSFQSEENEITLTNGTVYVTECGVFDGYSINISETYQINKYISI